MGDYLSFAKDLALRAGDIMLEHFMVGAATKIKDDNSPLTIADTAVNRMVIEEVAKHYPEHGVRGEEESNQQDHHEYVWVCDPIDGTIPYALGIPTNVFSLALVVNGEPIMGVVYDPYLKRMFHAEKGRGAFMNDRKIHVSADGLEPRVPIGLSSQNSIQSHVDLKQRELRIFTMYSCVYSAMLVAAGQFAAHVHSGTHSHDVAASKIIVEEAGGKVTDLDGEEQRYDQPINGAIISNGVGHDELIALIRRART